MGNGAAFRRDLQELEAARREAGAKGQETVPQMQSAGTPEAPGGTAFSRATGIEPGAGALGRASGIDPDVARQQAREAVQPVINHASQVGENLYKLPIAGVAAGVGAVLGPAAESTFNTLAQAGGEELQRGGKAIYNRATGPSTSAAPGGESAPLAETPGGPAGVRPEDLEPLPGGGAHAPARGGGGGGGAAAPRDPGPSALEHWRVGSTVRGAFDRADAAQADAIRSRQAGEQGRAAEEGQFFGDLAGEQQARADAMAKQEKSRAAVLQSYQEQYDRMAEEFANDKIDSHRYMNSRTNAQNIAGIVGQMLGGFMQGAQGLKSNPFVDEINQEIARDTQEQIANVELHGKALGAKHNAYAMAVQRFGDARVAENMLQTAQLDRVASNIKQLAAKRGSVEVDARAADALAAIEKEKAARLNAMLGYGALGTGGGSAGQKLDTGLLVTMPDGTQVYAASDKEGEKLRASSASVQNIDALTNRALALRDVAFGAGGGIDPKKRYDAYNQLKSVQSQLRLEGKTAGELGALSGPDQGLLDDLSGKLTSLGPGVDSQLKSSAGYWNESFTRKVVAQGAPVVQSGFVKAPNGTLKRQAALTGETYRGPQKPPAMPKSWKAEK